MRKQPDEVFLAKGVLRWPVELAEEILAKPLSWGPPTYGADILTIQHSQINLTCFMNSQY